MGLGVKNRSTDRQNVCRRSHRTHHLGATVIANSGRGGGGGGWGARDASTGRADPVSTCAVLSPRGGLGGRSWLAAYPPS